MAERDLPPPSLLRKLLRYDAARGVLVWLPRDRDQFDGEHQWRSWNNRCAGKDAGCAQPNGYSAIRIQHGACRLRTGVHRVVWALCTGEWPRNVIDHIDGDPSNNRIENLRAVTMTENQRNRRMPRHNTSGVTGVRWDARRQKWWARITKQGKLLWSASFDDLDKAADTIRRKRAELGFSPRHGS